jgi:hypothetical protein
MHVASEVDVSAAALAIFEIDDDCQAAKNRDARAHGQEGFEGPCGQENCNAGDEKNAPTQEPLKGSRRLNTFLFPHEALAHQQDRRIFGRQCSKRCCEDRKFAPTPGASENGDTEDGGKKHRRCAVLARKIRFGTMRRLCRHCLFECLHACLSGSGATWVNWTAVGQMTGE